MKKLPQPKENEIQQQILMWLSYQRDVFTWRNNNGAVFDPTKRTFRRPQRFSISGVSDILGVMGGYMICIEVKRPGQKPTPTQIEFIKNIQTHGGFATVASSLSDAQKFIEAVRLKLKELNAVRD